MDKLKNINRLLRYDILTSTTQAGSGHPTSCLSAVELMSCLFFNGFLHYDVNNPKSILNDRVIFSKGHAAPLLYSLYHLAGAVAYKELLTLRQLNSNLEGHPTPRFPFVDVATGSLGQGLSVGVGMALGIKLKIKGGEIKLKREPKVWVLLGDSEMAEGQNWEAMTSASHYNLNNLVGILDVNRLGQTDETMLSWDIKNYQKRIEAFGWKAILIENGHNTESITKALQTADFPRTTGEQKPIMLIAKTVKGKGISFLEDKNGWHGKPIPKEKLHEALKELGKIDFNVKGKIVPPSPHQKPDRFGIYNNKFQKILRKLSDLKVETKDFVKKDYSRISSYSTREAFGDGLVKAGQDNEKIVVFDAEMANSTFEEKFQNMFPERFFEMYIEEQNMISAALGISKLGFVPVVSTFASFLTRSYDQIRMAQYSNANIKIVGSHAGVFIGADGPSQMGLEDISMIRSILNSVVLCPSDATSTLCLTRAMIKQPGIVYMRTIREKLPVIYNQNEEFTIGGSKTHQTKGAKKIDVLIIATGTTVHQALMAKEILQKKKISAAVLDCYSIKPLDHKTISKLATKANIIVVVEDHYPAGGLGEAITPIIRKKFIHLCVKQTPKSGKPDELLKFEKIDADAIVGKTLNS